MVSLSNELCANRRSTRSMVRGIGGYCPPIATTNPRVTSDLQEYSFILRFHRRMNRGLIVHAGSGQSIHLQRDCPMIISLSPSDSHGSSSVNRVTHCRHEQGIRVMSVPQNIRSGPKAS